MIRAAIISLFLGVKLRPTSFGEIRTPALRKKCADLYRAMRRIRSKAPRSSPQPDPDFIPTWMRENAQGEVGVRNDHGSIFGRRQAW